MTILAQAPYFKDQSKTDPLSISKKKENVAAIISDSILKNSSITKHSTSNLKPQQCSKLDSIKIFFKISKIVYIFYIIFSPSFRNDFKNAIKYYDLYYNKPFKLENNLPPQKLFIELLLLSHKIGDISFIQKICAEEILLSLEFGALTSFISCLPKNNQTLDALFAQHDGDRSRMNLSILLLKKMENLLLTDFSKAIVLLESKELRPFIEKAIQITTSDIEQSGSTNPALLLCQFYYYAQTGQRAESFNTLSKIFKQDFSTIKETIDAVREIPLLRREVLGLITDFSFCTVVEEKIEENREIGRSILIELLEIHIKESSPDKRAFCSLTELYEKCFALFNKKEEKEENKNSNRRSLRLSYLRSPSIYFYKWSD